MSGYHQLTQGQRYQIYALKKTSTPLTRIAEIVGVHKSTISRELTRNRGMRGYRPKQAHRFTLERRKTKAKRKISEEIWRQIEGLVRLAWSPEQISSRMFLEQGILISHEWIYQHIYRDKMRGGNLHTYLRYRKKRRKRYGTYDAHPYASWEKGTNENTNSLIRQYFPKSMDFTSIDKDDIRWVMDRLNHRPRKKLGFKTPYEVFYNTSTTLIPNVALTS